MNQPLTYMDGETLMNTVLPPIHFVISQLLPQGLHVLAGAPKVGKSWLSLWLCLQVAKGEPAWEFPTTQSDVLYLCLEDSYSRIQNRLLDITDDAPSNLFFATMSEKLHSGLEQQIERFLISHPDTALIVIDTLQRIRGGGNDANPYASDYRDLGILTVHQMMKARRRENSTGEVQYFAGLVKCADCGSSLNVSYDKKRGRYTGFSCWVYKNYGKERCTSHAIGWKALNQLMLDDIRLNAQVAKLASEDYMNMLVSIKTEKKSQEISRCKQELKKVERHLGELEKILNKPYEDATLERYQSMAFTCEREQETLKGQREVLWAEITQGEEVYKNAEHFLPLIQKHTEITELNTHIFNALIEKIVVHG